MRPEASSSQRYVRTVHPLGRAGIALLYTLLCALVAGAPLGCGDGGNGLSRPTDQTPPDFPPDPGPDLPADARFSVQESDIRARSVGGELVVDIPARRLASDATRAPLTVAITDLGGNVVATQTTEISFPSSETVTTSVALPDFDALPAGTASSGNLAGYVIDYRVGERIHGRRSLFTAYEKSEVTLIAGDRINVDGMTHVRVLARDAETGAALDGRSVRVGIERSDGTDVELAIVETDATGMASVPISLDGEEPGTAQLYIAVADDDSEDRLKSPIRIVRESRLMLTTDKPVYQPGQRIHVRALALSRPSLRPRADREVIFEVADAQGNKVFREIAQTDAYGVAHLSLPLARELNQGNWRISATIDDVTTDRTVRVERYVLPRFSVQVRADQPYYRPGDTALIDIDARYFFGQPVSGARAVLQPYTFDVGFNPLAPVEITLDDDGLGRAVVRIPDFLVGQELEGGNAFIRVDFDVTDATEHTESLSRNYVVTERDIDQALIPASGLLRGTDATFYVVTRTPGGRPVATESELRLGSATIAFETDALGFAEVTVPIPAAAGRLSVVLTSTDANARSASQTFEFSSSDAEFAIALFTDGSLYRTGESVEMEIVAGGADRRLFLDVIREGQTLLTTAIDLEGGRAGYTLDLSPDLEGALQIDVYDVSRGAVITRGKRMIYVEGASDLTVTYTPDQEEYRPGEIANVDIRVTDGDGAPVRAALGVTIVDEAVFALQDMRPGLERVYFRLEEELLEPRYNVYGWSMESVLAAGAVDDREREAAASVVLALTDAPGYGLVVESLLPALAAARVLAHAWLQQDSERIVAAIAAAGEREGFTNPRWEDQMAVRNLIADYIEGEFHDAWGQAYHVETEYWSIILRSAGPDEEWDTDDDWSRRVPVSNFLSFQDEPDWAGGGGGGADAGMDWDEDFAPSPSPDPDDGGGGGGGDSPRVRQFFPETLLVAPDIITDEDGHFRLVVPLADNITTWRMTGLASSSEGELGSATGGLRVFQPFFVDINFPVELTQNDEVAVPVALFNYLDTAQTVTLRVDDAASGDWFTLSGPSTIDVDLQPGEVTVRFFDVRVDRVGRHAFQVTGIGTEMSDAVRRVVDVAPDGQRQEAVVGDRLGDGASHTIHMPEEAIEGASNILVRVYPGLFAQVVEGVDSLLAMPSGCFEQTSSTTYPNVLVLRYLRETGTATPELELRATEFIAQGYQRLVSYEVTGGGFEWFGNDPAHRILTAYGLLQFTDMSEVFPIDPAVIARTQAWLVSQQESDGRFRAAPEGIHEGATNAFQDSDLRATAYLTYALLESGYSGPATQNALSWIRANLAGVDDHYTLALVANGLLVADINDARARDILRDLNDAKESEDTDGGPVYWWESASQSLYYSGGNAMNMEVTALILQAMVRAGLYPDTIEGGVAYLVRGKDAFGNFASTQATILSLRLFVELLSASASDAEGTVKVLIDGIEAASFDVDAFNADLLRQADLRAYVGTGDHDVEITFDGTGSLFYQVVSWHYLPWHLVTSPGRDDILTIDVSYDRTTLELDEMVTVSVVVTNQSDARLDMVMLDLGVPPGFDVVMSDLQALADDSAVPISRVERRGRQLTVYVYGLDPGASLNFSYRMQATMSVRAQTPPSTAWLYYESDVRTESEPFAVEVN